MIQLITKAINDQYTTIQNQIQNDRDQIQSDYDHLNDLITKNADIIMELGKNHLDEVTKRKDLIKQIASIKSALVELHSDYHSNLPESESVVRYLDCCSNSRTADDFKPDSVEDVANSISVSINDKRQRLLSISNTEKLNRYKDTDSDEEQRVIPDFALGVNDDNDQFSLTEDIVDTEE